MFFIDNNSAENGLIMTRFQLLTMKQQKEIQKSGVEMI